jgi:peptidyl-prolyl cis-trans isomerase D
MISWIQRTFQQHFKWLFVVLLIVVIISFVFITNASSGLGQGGQGKAPDRPFFGLNLSNQEAVRRLMEDAQLSLHLRRPVFQEPPSEGEIQQHALQRHAALHFADQLRLPAPGTDSPEFAAYIQTLGRFAGPDGNFDPKAFESFRDSLKTNPRLTEGDVARVLLDDVRAQAYEKLLAGPGYVLPSDIAEQLARRDTRWTLALASIDGKSFAPRIDVSDTPVAAWFENHARRYEIAPRASVAAITFPAAADSVTVTETEVRAAYDANPERYPAPEAQPPAIQIDAKDPEAVFAAVRARVEADLRKQRAERAALAAADDLTVKLLEQRIATEKLPEFLAARGLTLEELGPVGVGAIPAALGGDAAAIRIAPEVLRLAADRPYSNPVSTPAGAAVLVWRESIPARVPALAEVRDQVLADYQVAERRRLFNEAGRQLRDSVAAAVAAGRPFAEAVTTAATTAGLKVEIKTPAPFTLTQPPQDIDFTAFQALGTLNEGQVSEFLPSRSESALLVHALKKEIPAFDPASPAAAEIKAQMAPILAQRNAQGILSAKVESELQKTAPATE